MTNFQFATQNKVGKRAIKLILRWLKQNPKVKSITDVEDDPKYRAKDIDLLVENVDGSQYEVEVKGDDHKSPNLFFETHSNAEKGTPGWVFGSHASIVLYVFLKEKRVWVLEMGKVRDWFVEHLSDFDEKTVSTQYLYHSKGRLVPKALLTQAPGVSTALLG